MAILKLYGSGFATCTRRVGTVLHELKIPFELVSVDVMNGAHKTPEYLEKQPFGQIPYIDDDGFILYETRAICRYPRGEIPRANALFEQAASAEVSNFDPSASKAGFQLMMKGFGSPYDQAVVDAQLEILDKKLEGYEAILSKQRYVAGDNFTLVDLFHIPYAPLVASDGSDIMTRKPNVARWYNELVARPSWLAYKDTGVQTTTEY
ncbi:glutathione S-transferase [Mycena olivaceomarginata]|nr:glutathione S-transferase [Mycena olivaceomarginata]